MNERELAKQLLAVAANLAQLAEGLGAAVTPETGPVDARVALEIGHHEAIIRQAYLDSGDTWTWSVGLTSATGHYVERYIDKPQPMQHCIDIYVWALKRYSEQVLEAFEGFDLPHAAFAGAASFHWNTGAIRSPKCTWPELYMAGKHAEAEADFRAYNKSGGKVNDVLVKRRKAEADLIWRGRWAGTGTMTEFGVNPRTHHPDWSSAKLVDVRDEIAIALGADIRPEIDGDPQPSSVPAEPTLSTVRLNGA